MPNRLRRGLALQLVPGLWVLALVSGTAAAGEVLFSEIHYHPQVTEGLELVELHNPGPGSVDLEGWSFAGGIRHGFSRSTVIPAGGFLVVARDRAALAAAHGLDAASLAGDYQGALDNDGERLALVDGFGRLVEEVRYRDGFPFAVEADGGGASLQRLCFEAPAEAPFNWRAAAPSPGSHPLPALCPPALPAASPEAFPVVLNEIYYHPPGETEPHVEFVELLNRSATERDLSSWAFDQGIAFTFPAGARVGPGGYLLVAEDPAATAARFGLDPARVLGPFEAGSRLSNGGETLRLVDSAGKVQDQMRYAEDGSWPAFADGLGGSLQRVDPLGPSDAPGNWVVATTSVPGPGGGEWRTFQLEGFHDGPRFYFYLLGTGEVLIDGLRLEVKDGDGTNYLSNGDFDDGLTAWSGTGNHSTSSAAPDGGFGDAGPCARIRATGEGNGFQNGIRQTLTVVLGTATRVVLTVRVKALSGESRFVARSSLAQSGGDLLYLEGDAATGATSSSTVTPLAPNVVGGVGTPPTIEPLSLDPARPTSQDPVAIQARVVSIDAPEVTVHWEHQGGDEGTIALADGGAAPDARAGDGIWSGWLPAAPHDTLVWLSLRAETARGAVTLWPTWKNPSPVTGYYVTDSLPESNADVRLYYIFTPGRLLDLSCDASRAGNFVDFRGRAYRDVGVKFRGETACSYPKRPIRVEFSKGDRFDRQKDLNFNAGWNDKSMLREKLGFDFFRDAGLAYSETHMARVHTVGGAFHGAYFAIEDPTEEYLQRNHRDPDGGLYKSRTAMLDGGTGGYESRTGSGAERLRAVGTFATDMNRLNGQTLIDFLKRNMDVEGMFSYQAVETITIKGDAVVKNWLLYNGRDRYAGPGPDLFTCFAWDLDLSYGQMLLTTDVRNYDIHPLFQTQTYPFHDQGYHGMLNALLQRPPDDYFVKAFYGRIWRLLEEKFNPAVLGPKLDSYQATTGALVREDFRKWPRSWGSRGGDPDYWRQDLRTFVQRRYDHLKSYLVANNPTTQGRRFQYVPAPRVKITEIHYNPPGDDERVEFIELTNLETAPVLLAGWDVPLVGYIFPAGTTVAAGASRILARDPAYLATQPGFAGLELLGPYSGELPNDGGVLRLRDDGAGGRYYPETIDLVVYEDRAPWPEAADGSTRALELVNLASDNDEGANWRAGWSPGTSRSSNAPPLAAILASPLAGPAPLTVLLDGSTSTDPEGDALSHRWELPGGATDTRPLLLHRFEAQGVYTVDLVVADGFGGEDRETVTITVSDGPPPAQFRRGDANGDGGVDLSDAVFTLSFLFGGGADPGCRDAADADDDQALSITDAIYSLGYLFLSGEAPPAPGPMTCGEDPSADALPPCAGQASCP